MKGLFEMCSVKELMAKEIEKVTGKMSCMVCKEYFDTNLHIESMHHKVHILLEGVPNTVSRLWAKGWPFKVKCMRCHRISAVPVATGNPKDRVFLYLGGWIGHVLTDDLIAYFEANGKEKGRARTTLVHDVYYHIMKKMAPESK